MMVWSGYRTGVAIFLMALGGLAQAQVNTFKSYNDASRADIETARRAQTQTFDERVRHCEATFAVTQCLIGVRSDKLAAQAAVDRRERELNDIQRSNQAQAQLERSQQKRAEHEVKLVSQAHVAAERGAAIASTAPKVKPTGVPLIFNDKPSVRLSAAQRSANRQEFQRMQREAEARRNAVEARIKANTKPAAALPLRP